MVEKTYCAFISYRHQSPDQEIAKKLHTAIETYRIPSELQEQLGRKRMGKVFRDQEELPLSSDLGADIEAALDGSEWFIAICSPRYLQSRWCLREMEYFIRVHGRDHVLAILVEGEPEDSFPEMICYELDGEGNRVEKEPLAADVRSQSLSGSFKKLNNEKIRLLAQMLSVRYDDLRQRDRRRRRKNAAIISAVSLVAAIGLAFYITVTGMRSKALRREAAINSIGELLEKAESALAAGEKRTAASELLEALELSGTADGVRRDEILEKMRRAAYVEPFSQISSFTNQNVRLLNIVPSPDGTLAVGIENSNSAALIDFATDEVRYKVSMDNYEIRNLEFSPDGSRFLAVCDMGRCVCVWNTEDGSLAYKYTCDGDARYNVANAFFWKDADTLLIQDMDRFYLVSVPGGDRSLFYTMGDQQDGYSYDTNLYTLVFGRPLNELITLQNDDYTGMKAVPSRDFSRILLSGRDGTTGTIVLDDSGKRVCLLNGMPAMFSENYGLSCDGRYACAVSYFGLIGTWDAESGAILLFDGLETSGGATASGVEFSPVDPNRAAFVFNDNIYLMDPVTGDLYISGSLDHSSYEPDVKFTSDGSFLLVSNQHLYIINAETGGLYRVYSADFSAPFNNTVSLGDTIFVTKNDGTAYLYSTPSVSTMREEKSFSGELCPSYRDTAHFNSDVTNLMGEHELTDAFKAATTLTDLSPRLYYSLDGSRAAVTYADGVIELFSENDGGHVTSMLSMLTSEISSLGMTADRLVAADGGGRLMFYDLEKDSVIGILNLNSVYSSLEFDPEGKRLLAMNANGAAVDVYDIDTAQLLFTMRSSSTTAFTLAAFTADGAYAVAYTSDSVVIADLLADDERLVENAKQLAALYQ